MSRLSIELTPEQHEQLRTLAALHGQTLKNYILERTLPHFQQKERLSGDGTLLRLEAFLKPRIAQATRGEVVKDSVKQIFAAVRKTPDG